MEKEEARLPQLHPNLEAQCEENDHNSLVEETEITNEELDCINKQMVQFPDESISMTVQRNNQETWVSFKYNDNGALHSHDILDFNNKEEVSSFEPQLILDIESEECALFPSVHYTELDDDEYWDSISSVAPVDDQEVQELVNHKDQLYLSDMNDLNVEDEPLSTNSSDLCDACLDHSSELNDDMIRRWTIYLT